MIGGADPWRPGLPDVAFKGCKLWVRGMDLRAVDDAMRFLSSQLDAEGTGSAVRAVLDPFCGVGSVLAGANAYGMAALGVDISPPTHPAFDGLYIQQLISRTLSARVL